jgi:hypothetical protein
MAVRRILVVVHDPGGTKAILPVLEALLKNSLYALSIIAGPYAQPILFNAAIKYSPAGSVISYADSESILESYNPQMLLTATSWNSNLEQQFRNVAFTKKVPSIVVLDFWANYSIRWQEALYTPEQTADYICVMDNQVKLEMETEGFRTNKIRVTGHPYLEKLFASRHAKNKAPEKTVEGKIVHALFLSQPFEKEKVVHSIEKVIRALEALQQKATGKNYHLMVKPHPKENIEAVKEGLLPALSSTSIEVEFVSNTADIESLIKENEVVFGFNTMALIEARAWSKKVLALEIHPFYPALKSAMQQMGIQIIDPDQAQINTALEHAARAEAYRNVYEEATKKIVSLISHTIH